MPSFTKVANGNVSPSRFVKLDTTTGVKDRVVQATDGAASAGDPIYGISGAGVRNAPLAGWDDGYHAIAGENCMVWGMPEKDVFLELGGTVTVGAFLKSDANGKGVATTTTGDNVGARASEAGVSGDLIRVQLISPALY